MRQIRPRTRVALLPDSMACQAPGLRNDLHPGVELAYRATPGLLNRRRHGDKLLPVDTAAIFALRLGLADREKHHPSILRAASSEKPMYKATPYQAQSGWRGYSPNTPYAHKFESYLSM